MRYCVKRDTTVLIDGSDNTDEIMIQNAINAGFKSEEVEIITEEDYQSRVENLPKPTTVPTAEERLTSIENALSTLLGV